ncbi:cache domain-containing protein, partial [Selenomonas noxia]
TILYDDYDNMIRVGTQLALYEVQSAYDAYKDGRLTEDEAKAEAAARVKQLRYGADNSGYFWIDDTNSCGKSPRMSARDASRRSAPIR